MGFWFQRRLADTSLTDLTNMFFVVRDCLLFYWVTPRVWELFFAFHFDKFYYYCFLAAVWRFFSHKFMTLTNVLLYYSGLCHLSALFNVYYIRLCTCAVYTYRISVAVVAVVDTVIVMMISDFALRSDLLVVYNELGVALTLLLHRS